MKELFILILIIIAMIISISFLIDFIGLLVNSISSWIIRKGTKTIAKNPKWITKAIEGQYYGFSDIDIIIVDSRFGHLPRFHQTKDTKRYELLISDDFTVDDANSIIRAALASKIKLKYGIYFPNKSIQWLSILCYMLDGKDIRTASTHFVDVNRQETN